MFSGDIKKNTSKKCVNFRLWACIFLPGLFAFLHVTAAFNVDDINNAKKFKRKSASRQKATQAYFQKKRIEIERQREKAAIDKTRPCEYMVKHGKCDFVSFTDDLCL